jgi:hypothetical protein
MPDSRSIAAIDVAEKHAHGLATDAELAAACNAAWDAVHVVGRDAITTMVRASVKAAAKGAAYVADKHIAHAVLDAISWLDTADTTFWLSKDPLKEEFLRIVGTNEV